MQAVCCEEPHAPKTCVQELNPVPFAVTFASTACWNAYGFAAPGEPSTPVCPQSLQGFTQSSCSAVARAGF
jgi:hypothetical protein